MIRLRSGLCLEDAGIVVVGICPWNGAVARAVSIHRWTLLIQHLRIAVVRVSTTFEHLVVRIIVGLFGLILTGRNRMRLQLLVARIVVAPGRRR